MIKHQASCPCGAVKVELDHNPEFINNCNCSLCEKARASWGYYNPTNVQITGDTKSYVRSDKPNPAVEIYSCSSCGTTTHWLLTKEFQIASGVSDRVGINMRLFNEDNLMGVEMRFPDGKAWKGEGEYEYRKAPIILGSDV